MVDSMRYEIKAASLEDAPMIYEQFIEPYFPEAEKKPLKAILRMMGTGLYSIIGAYQDDVPKAAAFVTTYPGGQVYLLDYLAVDKSCRSGGIGGLLLRECTNQLDGKPLLIETEALDYAKTAEEVEERTKRNRFYERNGASYTGVKSCVWSVTYDNWQIGAKKPLTEKQTIEELRNIYQFMFNDPVIYKEKIQIPLSQG